MVISWRLAMNNIRCRIATLAGGSVLVTLLLIMAAFNVIIRCEMKDNAETALNNILSVNNQQNISSGLYSPELIFVYETEQAGPYYTQKEHELIKWCDIHDTATVQKAMIGENVYYLLSAEDIDLPDNVYISKSVSISTDDGSDIEYFENNWEIPGIRSFIAYVDITGELNMIGQINFVFLVAALLIGSISVTIGYITGKKLEQNQLAQRQFFENTSHELKTPLTSIRGYAEGIETGVITDYRKTGRVIAEQTEKMSRLIEEILCLGKLESGSVELKRESVDIPSFMQDCLMPFEGTVLTKGLSVQLELLPLTVSADTEKLEHAVSNLLTNALKYAKTEIHISCDSSSITIENDCEPLTDDEMRHIFDRFYTGRGGNTGIGLSIAKELIGLHSWKLTAQRTEQGIAFMIRLEG